MRTRQLLNLRCPFCNATTVSLSHVLFWPGTQEVRSGLLHCSCDVFPIVEGIVVLRRSQHNIVQELLSAYQKQLPANIFLALDQLSELRLLERRVFVVLVRVTLFLKLYLPGLHRAIAYKWWKFGMGVLSLATSNTFLKTVFKYFSDRDRRPTYCLVAAVAPQLKKAKTVVEVGGGAGHFVREISQHTTHADVFSIEKLFWLPYWLVCNDLYSTNICPITADFEGGLPLKNAMADVVLANDTIMYVDHQFRLATELRRVMKKDAWCIGMHIHQYGHANVANGNGVRPNIFLSWLSLPYRVVWQDKELFQQLWKSRVISFQTKRKKWSVSPAAMSFSFIATTGPRSGSLALISKYQRNQLDYVEDQW